MKIWGWSEYTLIKPNRAELTGIALGFVIGFITAALVL